MRFSFPVAAMMVTAPCVMLGTVAAMARIDTGAYAHPGYGAGQHKEFLAYAKVMREAGEPAGALDPTHFEAENKALDTWLNAIDSGELKVIPAANADDVGETGMRAEIDRSKANLVRNAVHEALSLHKMGKDDLAAQLLSKGFRLSRELRTSSPRSLAESVQAQLDLIGVTEKVAPNLSWPQRAELAGYVRSAPMAQSELTDEVERFIHRASPSNSPAAVEAFERVAARNTKPMAMMDAQNAGATTRWWAVWALRTNQKLAAHVDEVFPKVSGGLQGPGIYDQRFSGR